MQASDIPSATHTTLNFRGRLMLLDRPKVMGILNLTPDSFSDGGRYETKVQALNRIAEMLEEGAEVIDIGGASSKPGAALVSADEEWGRIVAVLEEALNHFPEAIFSIDTFQAEVARRALDTGAHSINDISAGLMDSEMLNVVGAAKNAPYFMMHMKGNPQNMQVAPHYEDVIGEVYGYFVERIRAARTTGIVDLVVDPGFGFGKSMEHNYALLRNLDKFKALNLPILVGISRKSMIYRLVSAAPTDVLDLTAALHFKSLELGACILRVHDVKAAVRVVQLHHYWNHGAV